MITTIGEAYGEVDGEITFADNSPLIKSASFSRNLGATGRTRCAIGLAPPTSRAAGRRAFPFSISKCRLFQINLDLLIAVLRGVPLEYRQW